MNIETQRMHWRCRRGLLELDIVLRHFVYHHYEQLAADDLHVFDKLLDCPDNELLDLILGRTQAADAATQQLLEMLRHQQPEEIA